MGKGTCSIGGCVKLAYVRGMCSGCYQRWLRTVGTGQTCACGRSAIAKGQCSRCWTYARRTGKSPWTRKRLRKIRVDPQPWMGDDFPPASAPVMAGFRVWLEQRGWRVYDRESGLWAAPGDPLPRYLPVAVAMAANSNRPRQTRDRKSVV